MSQSIPARYLLFWSAVAVALTASAQPAPYRSAFDGYQPFADEAVIPWKGANDEMGRIGGWRVYARQARQPQAGATPAAPAASRPNAAPSKP